MTKHIMKQDELDRKMATDFVNKYLALGYQVSFSHGYPMITMVKGDRVISLDKSISHFCNEKVDYIEYREFYGYESIERNIISISAWYKPRLFAAEDKSILVDSKNLANEIVEKNRSRVFNGSWYADMDYQNERFINIDKTFDDCNERVKKCLRKFLLKNKKRPYKIVGFKRDLRETGIYWTALYIDKNGNRHSVEFQTRKEIA